MKQRLTQIKRSTVRILTGGQASGTGFVISRDGLIATCFHVVQYIQATPDGQTQITYASSIEVEFSDGNKLPATVHKSCQNQGILEALSKDYCILEVKSRNLVPLPLGTFADAYEGADIYLCGFPLGINQPVVAAGMFSTKWTTSGYLHQESNREVAWLDVTINRGNSGGPIVLIGKELKDDKVIGIASFGLNPFAHSAEEFIQIVQRFPGNVVLMGVDFTKFATLIGEALASNSLGVSGCVSIDYLKSKLGE
jgi:S1-C subfamily serine protease